MLNNKLEEELILQLNREWIASILYLNMASWAEIRGYHGICSFLYNHSNEERYHMLKLMKYINGRGGSAFLKINNNKNIIKIEYNSLTELFEKLFEHEKSISIKINCLIELSLKEKDYFTYNFLQWYIEEQMEEESLSKIILSKIKLLKDNKIGLYLFDKEIKNLKKYEIKY